MGLEDAQPDEEEDLARQLFVGWIRDTGEPPSRDAFVRLRKAIEQQCTPTAFVLRSQRLGVYSAAILAQALARLPIDTVDLYGNLLRDHGVQALAPFLRESKTLTSIDLGANDLGPLAAVYLSALLPSFRKLKVLRLGSEDGASHPNRIDGEAARVLFEAVGRARGLTSLDLSINPIGANGPAAFSALAEAIEKHGGLSVLRMGGTAMGTPSAVALVSAAAAGATVTHLDLHRNALTPPVGAALADWLADPRCSLRTLVLAHNPGLGHAGLAPVLRSLPNAQDLRILNIAATGLTDDGAPLLAEALGAVMVALARLDLGHNGLTGAGVGILCEALGRNTALTALGLAANALQDDGALALAAALEVHPALRLLDAASAQIGDKGAVALAVALASNTVLRTLRLGDNFLTDPGGEAVADLVAANRCLTGLDLRGNQVLHATQLRLGKVLRRNRALRDGAAVEELEEEAIRLSFQRVKLSDAQRDLRDHQRRRLELQEAAAQAEREALAEHEAATKRSKDVVDRTLVVENLIQDLKAKRRQKEEEAARGRATLEQDVKVLQDRLTIETAQREERQRESDALDRRQRDLERQRDERIADLQSQIAEVQRDREAWVERRREYEETALRLEEQVRMLEKQSPPSSARTPRKLSSKSPPKGRASLAHLPSFDC